MERETSRVGRGTWDSCGLEGEDEDDIFQFFRFPFPDCFLLFIQFCLGRMNMRKRVILGQGFFSPFSSFFTIGDVWTLEREIVRIRDSRNSLRKGKERTYGTSYRFGEMYRFFIVRTSGFDMTYIQPLSPAFLYFSSNNTCSLPSSFQSAS